MSYPATGIFHIAFVTGNKMAMKVKDSLTGNRSAINADIPSVGLILLFKFIFYLIYQL